MMQNKEITFLLKKPLWQMTGEEYVALHAYACSIDNEWVRRQATPIRCKGVRALAEHCSCSESQVHKLLREGILESAILSRIGKEIVFDGNIALQCAAAYQEQQRSLRKLQKLKSDE